MSLAFTLKRAANRALELIYPPRCASCGTVVESGKSFCEECGRSIVRIKPPVCLRCGLSRADCICSEVEPLLDCVAAPFSYDASVRDMLLRFKFSGQSRYKTFLAESMAETAVREYRCAGLQTVVCVPMTAEDERQRGYNQSALLAEELAGLLGLPFEPDAVRKIAQTKKQHDLSACERLTNLRGCFEAEPEAVRGRTLLLCDDIKTTGATLRECSLALYGAGAAGVCCICAAVPGLHD